MDLSWVSVATHLTAFTAGVLTTYAFTLLTGDAVDRMRHCHDDHKETP